MNKSDLVKRIAETAGFTQKDTATFVDAFMEVVTDAIRAGETIDLLGFGRFMTKERKERQGRDLKSGRAITIPATKIPVFKPGKALKAAAKA